MSSDTTTQTRSASTERGIALAETFTPLAIGVGIPLLDSSAAFIATLAYGGTAALTTVNYMNRLPPGLAQHLPTDILEAHRTPLAISTLTTGVALAMGALQGPDGADALMAGVTEIAHNPIPGIVSLGWWLAVGFVPLKLRKILSRPRKAKPAVVPMAPTAVAVPATGAEHILQKWGQHISDPAGGTHKGQLLTLRTYSALRWQGTITAPTGQSVTVTKDTISSVYQVPADWITFQPGAHAGETHITVNTQRPAELDPTTLTGAWRKWVARKGGLMDGTRLANVQPDPTTGGEVALVVAGENLDRLKHPDRLDLAGALRTNPLLISYEPRQNPREAVIRKMAHNPLQKGAAFPGVHVLKANKNGYIEIGPGVSGFPARIQLHDPALGAQHVLVAGVTGSGKGGTLQLVALAHHVNQSAIIYADPKGSSNPAITKMAAYSGLGLDGAIGALRLWYHGLMHRVAQSAQDEMKNFKATSDRPWVPLIFDEASQLLGENAEYRKEATFIIKAGASLGRSMGMPVILANQIMQLDQLGGEAAIRDNIFYGGSLILLRSDSQQKTLIDLPENFAGCNPADIPPAWSGDRDMVYDPNKPLNDPERTFGLAYAASPGGHAEMMRMWILEDATPHIDPNSIAHPADWPFWDQRDELALQSVLPADQDDDEDNDGTTLFPVTLDLGKKKPTSADDKILKALQDVSDPLGEEVIYKHKTEIAALVGVAGSTFDNALSRLATAGKIHRQIEDGKEVRGMYGLGPAPEPIE